MRWIPVEMGFLTPKRKASGSNPLRNTEYNAENLDVRGFRFFNWLFVNSWGGILTNPTPTIDKEPKNIRRAMQRISHSPL